MATSQHIKIPLKMIKSLFWLLVLVLTVTYPASARILDEDTVVPATTPEQPDSAETATVSGVPPVVTGNPTAATSTTATAAGTDDHHLSFFMHEILGGSNPSAKAVTGVVTNPAVNGQVPFAKPNGAVIPVNNGVLDQNNNNNNGVLNNNNIPFLTGLGGNIPNVIQNNGNNNNLINGIPTVNGAQLPAGMTLQKVMFGTLTIFDDELTEGHELGSGLVGKAQGFYVASSEDGTSQTLAFTAMFESGGYSDTLSFFGVHRTAVSESHLAVMGGTGKYVNAMGYATLKTFPATNQHDSDGVETLLQITVYLTY
ncbi:dirigent protein 25 [Juglans microcarpa x Juglans regia]|uniref:dirigent protein 25 n=1 Tax=Juglans microcarpa x Juglans regia TaxID=2249226 RepID=UPI001B7ED745|nr:dirigent protein 25 [Juglans microcarpa x Juglans regia]